MRSAQERLLRRREHEEKPTVVVVGGEEVRDRLGGQIALRVDRHALAQLPDAPLEHGADGVVPVLEGEAEHLPHLAADDLLVREAGELARSAPAADDPALLVADEEGRVGSGVVVVEQLEEEREAALRATLGGVAEARPCAPSPWSDDRSWGR